MRYPEKRRELLQKDRDEKIAAAKERTASANERLENAKK